jgi:hypothetical protein
MQHSQENVNAAATTSAYWIADQWFDFFVTSAGTITVQRVQSVTPKGSGDRLRVTITVADASLAANELLYLGTRIEGTRVADFQYGTASAKQSILRFGVKAPAGTYSVSILNSASNRSYIALFTITAGQANTDTEQTLTIPGDTNGTWLADTGIGLRVNFAFACGSTFQGTAGWQAAAVHGTSAVSNGMATAGAIFELFDVGLYLDPDATGKSPAWQMPDYASELAACLRYWQSVNHNQTAFSTTSGTSYGYTAPLPVVMRTQPAVATAVAGSATGGATGNLTPLNAAYCSFGLTTSSSGMTFSIAGRVYSLNARM